MRSCPGQRGCAAAAVGRRPLRFGLLNLVIRYASDNLGGAERLSPDGAITARVCLPRVRLVWRHSPASCAQHEQGEQDERDGSRYVRRAGDGKPDGSHHPNGRERPPRRVAQPGRPGAGTGASRCVGKDLSRWQIRSQIAQFSPCLCRVGTSGPVVELLKIDPADRVCIAMYPGCKLPIVV